MNFGGGGYAVSDNIIIIRNTQWKIELLDEYGEPVIFTHF